MYNLLQISN